MHKAYQHDVYRDVHRIQQDVPSTFPRLPLVLYTRLKDHIFQVWP